MTDPVLPTTPTDFQVRRDDLRTCKFAAAPAATALVPGQVLLQVDDSGPGMTETDRQRLGERFFRVLGSSQGGSGLGWSIVRRIAEAHRATIALTRSAALGGLAVRLLWPGMAEAGGSQP